MRWNPLSYVGIPNWILTSTGNDSLDPEDAVVYNPNVNYGGSCLVILCKIRVPLIMPGSFYNYEFFQHDLDCSIVDVAKGETYDEADNVLWDRMVAKAKDLSGGNECLLKHLVSEAYGYYTVAHEWGLMRIALSKVGLNWS